MVPTWASRILSIALLLLVASPASTQELVKDQPKEEKTATTNETTTLPEMVVSDQPAHNYTVKETTTATKIDTLIMETPATIQVVPERVIHDQQAYRLQDVLKNIPGVQSYHAYGGDHENFVVRGFLQSTVNYRNGIRIPMTKFDLANVERVEVLKGASAMLYGFNDAGGIINIITKRPSSTPHYSLEQRFGSYGFYRTEASATGPVSQQYGLNFRADLSYLNTGSFRQFMGNERVFVAPSLSWQPTANTRFSLTYEHFDEDNAYDYGIPALGKQLAPIPRSRSFVGRDLRNSTTNDLVDFRIDHRFTDHLTLNAGTVASHYDKNWEAIYTGAVNEDLASPTKQVGDTTRFYWFSPEKATTLTAWINGIVDFETFGVKHKALLGGEYYFSDFSYTVANNTVDTINIFDAKVPTIPDAEINRYRNLPPDYNIGTDSSSQAIYVQDQMTFWNNLHLLGGFRYDWVKREQNLSWWDDPATVDIEGKDKRNDSYLSPRVGLLYQPVPWLSVFGSFSQSFGPAHDYDNGGPKLYDLFTATQYEGGLKTQLFDGSLTANLVYFDLERTQFFQDPNSENIRLSVPVRGKSRGVEFDMQGQIYKNISLLGTYAYTDTEITADPTDPANVGKRLPYAPLHQGNVWLKYDFTEGPLKGFSLGGGVYAAGRRFGDAANSYSDDAYASLDLMAAYKIDLGRSMLTAQLNINNVNDADYFYLRSRRTNLPAEPLTVIGSIRLEY